MEPQTVLYATLNQLESQLGSGIRALRLDRNVGQETLADRAGVSVSAVKNLEAGRGTIRTLAAILRALDRASWIHALAPAATINPLTLPKRGLRRRRATTQRARNP